MKNIKSHSIFLGLALVGIFLLSILVFLSKYQLTSENSPKTNVELFYDYNHNLTVANNIIFIILLFVANLMFIGKRYWDTFIWIGIIFLTFTLLDWWWLSEMVFHYKKSNNLWEGESNLAPFAGIFIALLGFAVTTFNYLILKRIFKEKEIKPIKLITEEKQEHKKK